MTIDEDLADVKDRQARIENLTNGLTWKEQCHLSTVQRDAELALNRMYGGKISDLIMQRLLDGMILDSAVLATVSGGVNELPANQGAWDLWARQTVESDSLATICVANADEQLKAKIHKEALNDLDPAKRMELARNGTIDGYLDDVVKNRIAAFGGL